MSRLIAGFVVVTMISDSGLAHADLQFCNKTDIKLHGAVGEYDDGNQLSTGWYPLNPDKCKVVIGGDLTDDEYWAFAINSDEDYETDGVEKHCVMNKKAFNGLAENDCSGNDRRKELFLTIDRDHRSSIRVDFKPSNKTETHDKLDTSYADSVGKTTAGGSCTASYNKVCGDPDARAIAATIVPVDSRQFYEVSDRRSVVLAAATVVKRNEFNTSNPIFGVREIGTPDPHQSSGGWSPGQVLMLEQLYEPLLRISSDGQPVGLLAENWERHGDNWHFGLRKGVRFHSGRALEASVAILTFGS